MPSAWSTARKLDPNSPHAGPVPRRPPFSEGLRLHGNHNPSEKRVAALAATQHALFTVAQACAQGLTRQELRTGEKRSQWAPYRHRGVYGIVGVGDWPARIQMAAVLAGGIDAYGSHQGGAWLWGLIDRLWRPAISIPAGQVRRLVGVDLHRSSDLDRTHLTQRLRIPTTSPLRVMVDAGAAMSERQVRDMLDRGRALKLFTPMAVLAELERVARRGRTGVGTLRRILDDVGVTGSHPPSMLEAKMRRIIRQAGLPEPICEMVAGPSGEYRLDFPFPEALLDIEADGWDCHSSFDASHLDKTRQNKLTAEGYGFLRYDWTHATREAAATAKEIRTVYFQRRALFSEGLGLQCNPNPSEKRKRRSR